METLLLKKKDFESFTSELIGWCEVISPVKKEVVRFKKIKNPSDIYLGKNSFFPVKEFFFRKKETIFKFKSNKISIPKLESPKRVFFGLRKCDLNAISHQDKVFMETIKDPYYTAQRKNAYLIGYHCNEAPSKYCFCESLRLNDFFDLMLYDRHKDFFLVEIGSEKGKTIAKRFRKYMKKTDSKVSLEEKKIIGADRLLDSNIKGLYDNHGWQEGVDKCLSCTACTALCPTCYCFDLKDEVKARNLGEGERVRNWSSCQLKEFTKVAGNHVFREKREERFKHRIYHQLDYFRERYDVDLCTGCGRCIEGCPTRIDFIEIINKMKQGKAKK